MWRFRRKASVAVLQPGQYDELGLAELTAEIDALSAEERDARDLDTERRLVRLRHLAGIHLMEDAPTSVEFAPAEPDCLTAAEPLPEFSPRQLSPGLLRAGILRDGCVLVRGLVPRDDAHAFASEIERAFAEREHQSRGGAAPDLGYYEPFAPRPGVGEPVERSWIKLGGGLLAADAPRLHFQLMELFAGAELAELVSGYLGEPALISVHKTTLRKAEPSVAGGWHQDGAFMGPVRSLNLWLSLSRCGDEAPGLDIVPRRLEHYVTTATDEAMLHYQISQSKAEQAAAPASILRPIFEPGDALFFDELFLHQTGSDPAMPNPRYAVENWFFGGSGFPAEYAPVAV
jgi:hypothetical protein